MRHSGLASRDAIRHNDGMLTKLKAIARAREQTLEAAAKEMGMSVRQLRRIADGQALGTRDSWIKIISWSHGELTPNDLFRAEIDEAQSKQKETADAG